MTDKIPDGFNKGGMVESCLNVEADIIARLARGEFTQKAADDPLMAEDRRIRNGEPGREGIDTAFVKITTAPASWTDDAKAERVARAISEAAAINVELIDQVDFVQTGQQSRTPEGGLGEVMRPIFHINAGAATALARAAIAAMPKSEWTDDAKAELHVLALNLHNLSVELSRQHPCAATILEGYAIRIDELMKRVPEAAS